MQFKDPIMDLQPAGNGLRKVTIAAVPTLAFDNLRLAKTDESLREIALREVVESFMKSLEDKQFTLEDVAPLLFPKAKKNSQPRKAEKSASGAPKYKLKKGTVYQDPASNETWTAGGNGVRPAWIQSLLDSSADISSLVLIDSPQS
jgi:DNA-binding protein H-NS